MTDKIWYKHVVFKRFKAFESFSLHLRHFNIMVGPNNAGKSTVLAAFRILAAGLRRANTRSPQHILGPEGRTFGHAIDLTALSVGEENIFFNYDASEPASVTFTLTDGKKLLLYFPERESCQLIPDDPKWSISSISRFRSSFNCPIGFVPILGPVEHHERLYGKEAARRALFNYRAARNFRNIWHHYSEHFDSFRTLLRRTWPGMDIEAPEIDMSHEKPVLHMFCPEGRIPREIFWSGFGFQVWCQMLTHIVQSSDASIFLIDEPDIYLHSDLQRQLLSLLENLGPDILIATHSTEIISEAEPNDIVLIDKNRPAARRIKDPTQLKEVFTSLGSNLNPVLTQLAKTRRAIFVEGDDFQVFARFARKIDHHDLGNRATFAVVPIGGFSPERVRNLKNGIEIALADTITTAVILDRDFRSNAECQAARDRCDEFCDLTVVHVCKEVESFLLVPAAIERAARRRVDARAYRTGTPAHYPDRVSEVLEEFAQQQKSHVVSQYLTFRRRFAKQITPSEDEATTNRAALEEFEAEWACPVRRLQLIPAKQALSAVNRHLQDKYNVSVTSAAIIEAMRVDEIPTGMRELLDSLADFAAV